MIRVEELSHRYGDRVALDRVSFTVPPGEIAGVLGANGAGKSTLFKLLSTYLAPQSGSIEIAGVDAARDPLEVRARIGYLPEHNPLFDGMRVDRLLAFFGRAHGLEGAELDLRVRWVVDRCALADVLRLVPRECSKGYRQRIGLAAALIHDPPVLLLDEPTHGLDALQVAAFREFLRTLAAGRAILFSSHVLAEVASTCDRLLLLQAGRLVLDRPTALLAASGSSAGKSVEEVVLETLRKVPTSGSVGAEGART